MTTTIRLPEELHSTLKAEARRKGLTANALIISLIWEAVTKEEGQHETKKGMADIKAHRDSYCQDPAAISDHHRADHHDQQILGRTYGKDQSNHQAPG